MQYVTAQHLASLPTLAGLEQAARDAALADAGRVGELVASNEFATDDAVRRQLDADGWDPDRVTLALEAACELGVIVRLEPPAPPAANEPADAPDPS